MAFRTVQANFSKGELGPELRGRVDIGFYNTAVAKARNVQVRKYGGLTKRPGMRHVAAVHEPDLDKPVRLVPFQFSIEQAYALEMGQGYMRPAALGGMVTEEELAITGITKAVHAQITAAFHGFEVGDEVFVQGAEGMEEINGRIVTVLSVVDDSNFTIDLDTRTFGTFTGSDGGITRTVTPTPPTPPAVPPVVTPPTPPVVVGGGYYVPGFGYINLNLSGIHF